ncbi:MAG TPA: hypothetical protein VFV07_04205, partial [Rhizomicrobium sp.]|nr:hypothetical protein [Rhizomicrobium sp.]
NIGGLDGYDEDAATVFTDAYWDMTLTGIDDPSQGLGNNPNEPGITGLTHTQLISSLPAGFDPAVWGRKKKINGGMPYLLANPPPDAQ